MCTICQSNLRREYLPSDQETYYPGRNIGGIVPVRFPYPGPDADVTMYSTDNVPDLLIKRVCKGIQVGEGILFFQPDPMQNIKGILWEGFIIIFKFLIEPWEMEGVNPYGRITSFLFL